MERAVRIIKESEESLRSIWCFTGVPTELQVSSLERIGAQLERVVADAVREAERMERRLVVEARAALEAIYRLSSHLSVEITSSDVGASSVVGPLAKLYGQGMRLSCSPPLDETRTTSRMRHKDWPLSRPLAPEVEEVMKGHSLDELLISLRAERASLEAAADENIHNLFCLNRYEQLLKLPVDDQSTAWAALLTSSESLECTASYSHRNTFGSPGSARKRSRESDVGSRQTVGEPPQESTSATLLEKRSLRSQDISKGHVLERVQAIHRLVDQQRMAVSRQCDEVRCQIRDDVEKLSMEDGLVRNPVAMCDAATASVAEETTGGRMDPPAVSLLFPEVSTLLGIAPPTSKLQCLLRLQRDVRREYLQLVNGRLDEAIVMLAEVYRTFHSLTGNTSYVEAPDYHLWARKSVFGASAAVSHVSELHHESISKIQDATRRANEELSQLQRRIAFIRDHVMPLWSQRRDILTRKDQLKNMSADRLFNKRGNMAKVLLEEETLRKEVSKKLPKIRARLLDLCHEWQALFGEHKLLIEGQAIQEILTLEATEQQAVSTVSRGASIIPHNPDSSKENSPLAKAMSCTTKPSSKPSSRRPSPAQGLLGKAVRSTTPSPPPTVRRLQNTQRN